MREILLALEKLTYLLKYDFQNTLIPNRYKVSGTPFHSFGNNLSKKIWALAVSLKFKNSSFNDLYQGAATFSTSGPHPVLTRFQQALTIPEDQNRKIFARNSGLFLAELMAKIKKRSSPGTYKDHFSSLLLHNYYWKRKKVAGRMTINGCGPGKMPQQTKSGPRAVGCQPLTYTI